MRTTKLPSEARLALLVVLNRETIGQRIADRRDDLDLTQEELAERIGVRAQTVSRWERGANLGRLNNLERVAQALEMSVADLMAGLDGEAARPTPRNGESAVVAELRGEVAGLRGELVALRNELLAELGKVRKAPAAQRSRPKSAVRSRAKKSS